MVVKGKKKLQCPEHREGPTRGQSRRIAGSNFPRLLWRSDQERMFEAQKPVSGIKFVSGEGGSRVCPAERNFRPTRCMSTVPTAPRIGSELHSLRRSNGSQKTTSSRGGSRTSTDCLGRWTKGPGREKAAANSEDRDHERIQFAGEEKPPCRDERPTQTLGSIRRREVVGTCRRR